MHVIYKLTSPSGKSYIGQTNQGQMKDSAEILTKAAKYICEQTGSNEPGQAGSVYE